MGLMAAILAGVSVGSGILLVVVGATRRVAPSTGLSPARRPGPLLWWGRQSRSRRLWFTASMAVGVLASVLTGWLLAALLIPVFLVAVPLLLTAPPNREVELLAGLDRWVRLVATSISSGKSIRDAFFATRRQAPPVLKVPVTRLCGRLEQRWPLRDALLAMADEVSSADADAVVAAMIVASSRGGGGVKATLDALSDNIQDRLRALREISAERAKPRAVARQVTIITLTVLGGALLFNGQYFEPYHSTLGQVLAAALAVAYVGCLIILRRLTLPAMAPRFLRSGS